MANEKRLIDYETAKKGVMEILAGKVNTVAAVKVAVAMQEATVDAVEVVRCKDCKCFSRNFENDTLCRSVYGLSDPEEDDFCSYGERRTDV